MIAQLRRQADAGTPVTEIVRKLCIHENAFYGWKKRFGGLGTPEIRELRQLRDENTKLKKFVGTRRACRLIKFSRASK